MLVCVLQRSTNLFVDISKDWYGLRSNRVISDSGHDMIVWLSIFDRIASDKPLVIK